jgi:hypothetical protein
MVGALWRLIKIQRKENMKFVKKYFKLFIGICVLILAIVVFFFAKNSTALETGLLNDWRAASMDRRVAAAKILTGNEEEVEWMVACIDKITTLPKAGEMAVRDAASLCYTGRELQQNM